MFEKPSGELGAGGRRVLLLNKSSGEGRVLEPEVGGWQGAGLLAKAEWKRPRADLLPASLFGRGVPLEPPWDPGGEFWSFRGRSSREKEENSRMSNDFTKKEKMAVGQYWLNLYRAESPGRSELRPPW